MTAINIAEANRYARCIQASKRVRWDIEADVIRGRRFDRSEKYLSDGLSLLPLFGAARNGWKSDTGNPIVSAALLSKPIFRKEA